LFDGSLLTVRGRISASNALTASLQEGYAWVGGAGSVSVLVATSSFGSGIFSQIGLSNAYGTGNDIQISGSLSASLAQGYVWVGGPNNITKLVATSSFGSSLAVRNYNGSTFGAFNVQNVTTLAFSGSSFTIADLGGGSVKVESTGTGGGGTSGTSGTSGINGLGNDGSSGTSGTSGTSAAAGAAGTSGTSGTSGLTAQNGTDGSSGTSGTSGTSGAGTPGTSGTSGTTGNPGDNGSSGSSGTSGTSGLTPAAGTGGSSGTSGTSGTTGLLSLTGTTTNGVISYDGVTTTGVVESSLTFDSTTRVLELSGSADIYVAAKLRPILWAGNTPPAFITPSIGMLTVSSSFGLSSGDLLYYNGLAWVKLG